MTHNEIVGAPIGTEVWDQRTCIGAVTGLHVRVLGSGKRHFYFFYRTRQGRSRRPKIGAVGKISLSEARRRARILLDKIATGEDPKGNWDSVRDELFVQELYEEVWEEHWNQARFHISGWSREVKNSYSRHIGPAFGMLKLSEVSSQEIKKWHAGLRRTPIAGNRALEVLSKMFRTAHEKDYVTKNPCSLTKSFVEAKRERYATKEEITRIGALLAQETENNPAAGAFLYCLIFTGARPKSIADARQEDLKRIETPSGPIGILTFDGKSTSGTGKKETVILPPAALKALDAIHPKPKDGTLTGLKMPRKMWQRIKLAAGCPDLWARDWRKAFSTYGMSYGVPTNVVGELLNQKSYQTTMRYAQLVPDKRIEAAVKIASQMELYLAGIA